MESGRTILLIEKVGIAGNVRLINGLVIILNVRKKSTVYFMLAFYVLSALLDPCGGDIRNALTKN